jgi:hypothetical protein
MALVEKRDEQGKRLKTADGEQAFECVWTEPILIPYFDDRGRSSTSARTRE